MKPRAFVLAGIGLAAAVWVGVSAQQEMLPRPGPGSGITPVRLVEEPTVTLSRTSEVRIAGPVAVAFQLPGFATKGRTLLVTWANGDEERITISEVVEGSWLSVQSSGGSRYVNLASARSAQIVR